MELNSPQQSIFNSISRYNLWDFSAPVVLAVSGGRDSMVMLEMFYRIASDPSHQLLIAHINHNAGEFSAESAEFVKHQAELRKIPYVCIAIAPWTRSSGESMEKYWREQRYKGLHTIRTEVAAAAIVTAHTASDHLETILFRLVTGTGPRGLVGIQRQRSDSVIRPMLDLTREEITDFAKKQKIQWIDDPSNDNRARPRNAIRHSIIPLLQNINHQAARNAVRTSSLLDSEDEFLSRIAHTTLEHAGWIPRFPIALSCEAFQNTDPVILQRCAATIYKTINDSHRCTINHILKLTACLQEQQSYCPLPNRFEAVVENSQVIISAKMNKTDERIVDKLDAPCDWTMGTYDMKLFQVNEISADAQVVSGHLKVRNRLAGDRWVSPDSKSTSRLSDRMREHRIPACLRNSLPLLVADKNKVRWIPEPFCIDSVIIQKESGEWLKLTCQPRSAIR